jgi:prevent-host-death family protein
MKRASISEAKNRLSAYLALVRRGETILITDRNVPVAQIVPLAASADPGDEERLRDLERRGVIRRAKLRPGRDFLKSLPRAVRAKGDALAALLAERDETR